METPKQKQTTSTTIHESKNFPFVIVEKTTLRNEPDIVEAIEKIECKIAVGNAYMSDKTFDNMTDAEDYIESRPWELITNLICFTIQNANENEKLKS